MNEKYKVNKYANEQKKEDKPENYKKLMVKLAYEEIFSVDYLNKDEFSVDLSFTILDWLIIDRVQNDKTYFLKNVAYD